MNNSNDIYKNSSYLQKTTPTDLAAKNPPNKKDFEQVKPMNYTLKDFQQLDLMEECDPISYYLFI